MPFIDVNDAILDVDLADTFNVVRRSETINNNGFATLTQQTFNNIIGVVYTKGDNELKRREDYDMTMKQIVVVTPFALQASAPGMKPDLINWPPGAAEYFVVHRLEDYSRYGRGWVRAYCTSIQYQDPPPQIQMPTNY